MYAWHMRADPLLVCQQDVQDKNNCYNKAIDATLKTHGLSAAFDLLAEAYNADPGYLATCHAETHELGKEAYKEFHATGRVELSDKTSYCGYGFYHGFMEELIYENNNFDEARAFCSYAGTVVPNPPGYAEGACYHGVGHGVTDGTDPRVWGDAQKIAAPGLALCKEVAGGNTDHAYRCASGVFNAVALMYRDAKYQLTIGGEPFSLCGSPNFTTTEKDACYDQMNTLATFAANYHFGKAIAFTEEISDPHYRELAVRGVAGTYFSTARGRKMIVSPKEVSGVCSALTHDADACITGVVVGIQEFGTPGAEYTDMLLLCGSPDIQASLLPACYSTLLSATKQFYGSVGLREVCTSVPDRYKQNLCV